jgi:toxin FitB
VERRPRGTGRRHSGSVGKHVRAILDTSVVIAADVPTLEGELAVSAITLAELHFGVLVAKDQTVRAERLRRLLLLQRTFDAIPVDGAVAASYGQLAAAIVEAGRRPRARSMDLLIAATAHAHSARLFTRNIADFVGLENLVEVVAA